MSYIFTFLAGFSLHFAYTKGWLDTPIAWVVSQWVAWRAKP